MKHTIKVLLANGPDPLRTFLVDLLQPQNDVEVVGSVLEPIELLMAVEDTQADVVVLTLPDSGQIPGICSHLFDQYPHLLILALSPDNTKACVYQQVIAVEELMDISEENLLTAIRKVKIHKTG
jgi:DNA-binding NarL/FixJ family response regulator